MNLPDSWGQTLSLTALLLLLGAGLWALGGWSWRQRQAIAPGKPAASTTRYWAWLIGYALASLTAWALGARGMYQGLGWGGLSGYLALPITWLVLSRRWWQRKPLPADWQPMDWAMAAVAPLALVRKWQWRMPTGQPLNRRRRRRARRYLRREWDIRQAEDWTETAQWLLETGQRMAFHAEIDHILTMDETTLAMHLTAIDRGEVEPLHGETKTEQLARIHWIRQEGRSLLDHSYLAWDLLRLIDLCRWGLRAGLLEVSIAERYATASAQALQQRYRTWQELYQQYWHGWRYWSAPDFEAGQAALHQQLDWCRTHRRSPWRRLPWDLPLNTPTAS